MKQWYSFYTNAINGQLLAELELHADISEPKLNQLGSEIKEWKLNRDGSEIAFPPIFAYVPWRHHVLIMQKCKSVEEALFYIQKQLRKTGAAVPWMIAYGRTCIIYRAVH